jgi:hypothetical protein
MPMPAAPSTAFYVRETVARNGTYPARSAAFASGINDVGTIVGRFCPTTACHSTIDGALGFLLSNGSYTTFAMPGEPAVGLASINDQGVITGNYLDAAGLGYAFVAVER